MFSDAFIFLETLSRGNSEKEKKLDFFPAQWVLAVIFGVILARIRRQV